MRHVALALVALAACTGGDEVHRSEHRYFSKVDGFSVDHPDGWTQTMDRGAARFAPASSKSKKTIIVRSSVKPAEITEGNAATNTEIANTTERVLRALPGAKVTGQAKVTYAEMPGVRYSLTFVPNGLKTPYRRTHVMLIGEERLFHVIFTAPKNERLDESTLKQMVTTLKEEL